MYDHPRLNRLFAADQRCFDVAIDHGFFNEPGFLTGIENIAAAVATIRDAAPDAVQLTAGQAHHLQDIPGKDKPALVLRTDVANVYGNTLPAHVFSQLISEPVEQALRLDTVRALLTKIVSERPDGQGNMVPCDTWDNAILACEVAGPDLTFPMTISTKRISPGHQSTMFLRVQGTNCSAEFTTRYPKQVRYLPYSSGGEQAWRELELPFKPAYPTITGEIFEFGFTDAILQMWAAYCDELAHGRSGMHQPFTCVRPDEVAQCHDLFTAALSSQRTAQTVSMANY